MQWVCGCAQVQVSTARQSGTECACLVAVFQSFDLSPLMHKLLVVIK